MRSTEPFIKVAFLAVAALALAGCSQTPPDLTQIDLRAENLTVTPATGPVAYVLAYNRTGETIAGTLSAKFPDGWKLNTTAHPVTLEPGQLLRLPFAIERGIDSPDNAYPVEVSFISPLVSSPITRKQVIRVASATFFKPKIEADPAEWADAIPATFLTSGKRTTIRTFWNRQQFCLMVEVEEKELLRAGTEYQYSPDAVQFAISPRKAATPESADDPAQRHEFLLVPALPDKVVCYRLIGPDQKVKLALQPRKLSGLEFADAQVALSRKGNVTVYACAIPFSAMPEIQPDAGREIHFSLLVHDPDGTGLRNWADAAGLWPWQRTRLAWCYWQGSRGLEKGVLDSAVEWGLSGPKR